MALLPLSFTDLPASKHSLLTYGLDEKVCCEISNNPVPLTPFLVQMVRHADVEIESVLFRQHDGVTGKNCETKT
jgi:hypothetical protein